MTTCIIQGNADPTNIGPPSVQIAVFSSLTDDANEDLVPFCVSVDIVPNNPTFNAWTAALEAVDPFANRTPINVRVYTNV
uniref:Uncharacterized protein n=1 Tax=Marseillevirus LCMAC101 TaxID=2506602 RepID=A0A481YT38_9VIRU|nr:MAG: hypothetical protein LCMAC101_05300 [Marseillevirus LCMAC101]